MDKHNLMDKYKKFTEDYNNGISEDILCMDYNIPPEKFDAFLVFLKKKGFNLKKSAGANTSSFQSAHDIDFEIFGDDMQFVEIELDPGETVIAEAGAMMFMERGISMETIFGDGSSESQGVMSKIFGAGKRILTGESLFMTAFTSTGPGKQHVAFSSAYPGRIVPLDLADYDGELLCQKRAFLCAAKGVSVSIAFTKKFGTGLFGGEGFILQKLTGDGYAFIHAGGTIVERVLGPGDILRIDTGCIVALEKTLNYDIEYVGGIKTALFGGEGLFFATVTGPGRVWLQSLPFSRLANNIVSSAPRAGGTRKGEGSILGIVGDMLDGR